MIDATTRMVSVPKKHWIDELSGCDYMGRMDWVSEISSRLRSCLDFGITAKNRYKKRVTVDERVFDIMFWNDLWFNLSWVGVKEVISEEHNSIITFFRAKVREKYIDVGEEWTDVDRIDVAMKMIMVYIERESRQKAEMSRVIEFCK